MSETTTITLKKPIEAHDETVTELSLRPPVGRDITRCGLPIATTGESGKVDTTVVASYISTLGNIPPSSVATLDGADFMAALLVVVGFFGDMMGSRS